MSLGKEVGQHGRAGDGIVAILQGSLDSEEVPEAIFAEGPFLKSSTFLGCDESSPQAFPVIRK